MGPYRQATELAVGLIRNCLHREECPAAEAAGRAISACPASRSKNQLPLASGQSS